jgi:hypothetical protein
VAFQVAYPEDVELSVYHQAIWWDRGEGELHILLAGYVDVDQWEYSTGSNPDANG